MTAHLVTAAAHELEEAHRRAVRAATAGLEDSQLGPIRLTGPGAPMLADAAVTSATPFLRAPALARISAGLLLHPAGGADCCPTCGTAVPCQTAQALSW